MLMGRTPNHPSSRARLAPESNRFKAYGLLADQLRTVGFGLRSVCSPHDGTAVSHVRRGDPNLQERLSGLPRSDSQVGISVQSWVSVLVGFMDDIVGGDTDLRRLAGDARSWRC